MNLSQKTCACHRRQLTGNPCKHVVCAIYEAGQISEDYVDDYFKKEAYIRTYTPMIYLVPREHDWTRTISPDIDPAKFEKHAVRPKKRRRGGLEEGPRVTGAARMTTTTCSNCGVQGHSY